MTTNPRYSVSSISRAVRCGLLSAPVVAGLTCIALAGASLNATAQQAPSSAQNTTSDSDQLVEVVVTAERRAENI